MDECIFGKEGEVTRKRCKWWYDRIEEARGTLTTIKDPCELCQEFHKNDELFLIADSLRRIADAHGSSATKIEKSEEVK